MLTNNLIHRLYYYGCASGIVQCLIINEGTHYFIYLVEICRYIDFNILFGHIQLSPYSPQIISGTEDDSEEYTESYENESDDSGYSEDSDNEKKKGD